MLSCLVPRFGQEEMPSSTKFDLQCKRNFSDNFYRHSGIFYLERKKRYNILECTTRLGKRIAAKSLRSHSQKGARKMAVKYFKCLLLFLASYNFFQVSLFSIFQ